MNVEKISSSRLPRFSREKYLSAPKIPVIVCLDNVRSGYNVGSILRSCDAFHVEKVIGGGYTPGPSHPEVAKTALGAQATVSFEHAPDLLSKIKELKNGGCVVCIVEHTTASTHLSRIEVVPEKRYVLVFGNELTGVSSSLLSLGDVFIEVEQRGTKHSLNVSVCAGIVLWYFFTKLWRWEQDGLR